MLGRSVAGVVVTTLLLMPVHGRAVPSGIAGRTLKSTTSGCGGSGCHGSGPASSVTVSITGPDTVIAGQSAGYTVAVTGSGGADGGVDIAARNGTLAVVSSWLKLSSGEAVHRQRVAVPSTYQVTYTAPASPGVDTMYATGKDNAFSGWNFAPNKPIRVIAATAVEDPAPVPRTTELAQNFPNPFNPSTEIRFTLASSARVRLEVFDLTGRRVALLADGDRSAGEHTARFDAQSLAGGVYLYRLTSRAEGDAPRTMTRKMLLTK